MLCTGLKGVPSNTNIEIEYVKRAKPPYPPNRSRDAHRIAFLYRADICPLTIP